MARVTGSEVKEIINTKLTASEVEPFILAANSVITAMCSSASYDATHLKELERWLTAHLVAIRDPSRSAVVEQKAGSASQKLQVAAKDPTGLATTPYGQQVLILDYLNTLSNLGRQKATIRTFGAGNAEFD